LSGVQAGIIVEAHITRASGGVSSRSVTKRLSRKGCHLSLKNKEAHSSPCMNAGVSVRLKSDEMFWLR
jgi:hypothetical protein